MDLKSLRARLTRIGIAVAPPLKHPGLIVRFVDAVDGKPVPRPADAPPHRQPEARDPRDGLDILFLDVDGVEISRCV
jgi:hypothetical protein